MSALSEKIIGAAFEVSNIPGAGFLDKVYENSLNVELNLIGLKTLQQAPMPELSQKNRAKSLSFVKFQQDRRS